MTAQVLASELGNLIQESKRKHNDLKQASEKSLEELRTLAGSSEARIGADLAQRTNFVNPFVIACGTRNVKFTSIAIVCLQRLIAARGVPRGRLDQVLQALRDASSGGLDVQLRILQSLPSLLQNYTADVSGDLLISALNICFVLQASKNIVVNNTASATLQQLLIAVFDKVSAEDQSQDRTPPVGEAPIQDGTVALRPAALDAYHVFHDICLLTESDRPEYLRFSSLSQTFGLELIESVLTNDPSIFASHPEQAHVLRSRLIPFLTTNLLTRPPFATAVRLVRVLYTILRYHMPLLAVECAEALGALSHVLDHDPVLWKRVLCLEAIKGLFSDAALPRQIYTLYDAKENAPNVLQDLLATFVRVSTEKPSVIGLGHQSTIPISGFGGGGSADQAVLEASGVPGIISGSVGAEGSSTGISSQWSSIRTPCIDQLDKAEPLAIPDSYIYSLLLACITSLSEGLAKFILPLTVPGESRNRKKALKQEARSKSPASAGKKEDGTAGSGGSGTVERSASFKKTPVPKNPLLLTNHPLHADVQAYADMIDNCWPAILATCSTFLYAALDSEYYHSLVRAFQRFTHVAGLLQLTTPRDAFLTTLGKAAVPPNVLTACLNAGARPMTPTSAASDAPNTLFSNARGLLSVDSLVSQSSASEKPRQGSSDTAGASINTRNLLCLRALLNLGIALGPSLEASWQIVLETLQQADFVLFCSGKSAGRTLTVIRSADPQAEAEANQLLANFGSEVKAVETAASRLFESTVDFPNEAFVTFVDAVCGLLEKQPEEPATAASGSGGGAGDDVPSPHKATPIKGRPVLSPTVTEDGDDGKLRTPVVKHKRVMSFTGAPPSTGHVQEDQFVLAKLGDIASINLERLLFSPPDVSGWVPLTSELARTLGSARTPAAVRMRAAETLVRFLLEAMSAVSAEDEATRGTIQLRLLETMRGTLVPLQKRQRGVAAGSVASHATDVDIHKVVLDGLKSILEDSGETLVSGWTVVFAIIDSIFVEPSPTGSEENAPPEDLLGSTLTTRSVRLIKPSFASLQLICSDFLPSLPNTCYLDLVNTLYKFCSQDDDLNVALTTVTFYWAISDFLHVHSNAKSIASAMDEGSSDAALVKLAYNTSHPGSGAALWMLLLLRLTAVTTDQRLELRNSAVQTLLRIIQAYGDNLTAEAWDVCIRAVVFRLLLSTESRLRAAREQGASQSVCAEWDETAVVIVNGVSELLASYLEVLAPHAVFSQLWKELLGHFATMLDFESLEVSTAVFGSLGSIMAKSNGTARWHFDKTAVELAWSLWSRSVPAPAAAAATAAAAEPGSEKQSSTTVQAADNQKCLLSWVNAFLEIERLVRPEMDLARTQEAIRLLREAVLCVTPGTYAHDTDFMTPLETQILRCFSALRTDIAGAPSAVITQLSEFVTMAVDRAVDRQQLPAPSRSNGGTSHKAAASGNTYVAMARRSMELLHQHVTEPAVWPEIFSSGAFVTALAALAKPITLKYGFPIQTRVRPWKVATKEAVGILVKTLPHLQESAVPRTAFQGAWDQVVAIASGTISADLQQATSPQEEALIAEDEEHDVSTFCTLRQIILPALGSAAVAEKTRRAYVEELFRVSILHAPALEDAERLFLHSSGGGRSGGSGDSATTALGHFLKVGRGRTMDPVPTKRAKMSFLCLDELFSLVAAQDGAGDATGDQPDKSEQAQQEQQAQCVRLAQTAAPFLILRCALPLRAYAADQPLRGHMPQPLSQRRELERILRQLVDLRSDPGAIPDLEGVESEGRKHLLRLYPLLVAAGQVAGIAGDAAMLGQVREALDAVGAELGV